MNIISVSIEHCSAASLFKDTCSSRWTSCVAGVIGAGLLDELTVSPLDHAHVLCVLPVSAEVDDFKIVWQAEDSQGSGF